MNKVLKSVTSRKNGNCDNIPMEENTIVAVKKNLSINPKIEESAMAVVLCEGKILATKENIYGNVRISLPKGHVEKNETELEASIRECFEETNIVITRSNLVKKLTPFSYEFTTPTNILIRKTLIPFLFEVRDFGNPISKEERILSIEWMNVQDFLSVCSYDNVKNIVKEAINFFKNNF